MDALSIIVGFILGAWIFYVIGRQEFYIKSGEGLFFCLLNRKFVWLNKSEVIKFFLEDHGE